jgi:Periplasmic binding protein domain
VVSKGTSVSLGKSAFPTIFAGIILASYTFVRLGPAAPNQQAIPAVEYLMSKEGGAAKRFFLAGL